jgi:glycosyltransferase involved in cell wall biosynthesis
MAFLKKRALKLYLVIVTENRAPLLAKQLDLCAPFFDGIVVVDGGSTDNTRQVCARYSHVRFVHHEFDDVLWDESQRRLVQYPNGLSSGNLAQQFNVGIDHVPKGAWALLHDDDEWPTLSMLYNLRRVAQELDAGAGELGCFPCVLVVNGLEEFSPEWVYRNTQRYIAGEPTVPFEWEPFYRWNLFQVNGRERITGVTHYGPSAMDRDEPWKWDRVEYPYPWRHVKTGHSWIVGDLWPQAVWPEGHGLTPQYAKRLKDTFVASDYRRFQQVMDDMRSFTLAPPMLELIHEWKDDIGTARAGWYQHLYYALHPDRLTQQERLALKTTPAFLDFVQKRRWYLPDRTPLSELHRIGRIEEAAFYPQDPQVDKQYLGKFAGNEVSHLVPQEFKRCE